MRAQFSIQTEPRLAPLMGMTALQLLQDAKVVTRTSILAMFNLLHPPAADRDAVYTPEELEAAIDYVWNILAAQEYAAL